jgi:hypothetical protein
MKLYSLDDCLVDFELLQYCISVLGRQSKVVAKREEGFCTWVDACLPVSFEAISRFGKTVRVILRDFGTTCTVRSTGTVF